VITAEMRSLKETLQKIKEREATSDIAAKKGPVLRYLAERSVKEDLAARLCEKVESVRDVPSQLSREVKVKDPEAGKKVIMLVGPTGVGKTTTIAKLAGRALREGRRTGIVSLDTYRIGAIEQMRIYARIMGIPLSIVSTPGECHRTLLSLVREKDAVFVDTPGRNPSDEEYIAQLRKVCDTTAPLEVHLLMSATSDYEYMLQSYKAYKRIPIDCVGFTKVDEAVRFGSLYNFLVAHQKPISYVTTGQKVPDDIEFPTSDGLAQLILTKGCYRC
jgi:flagellar biosynthesis protein FlhF